MAEAVKEITDADLESRIAQAETPMLVDFWAPWCGPCKAIAPIVDQLATGFEGQVAFFKCNVDENPRAAAAYGIRAIPTLLIFSKGKVADQITGMVSKARIEEGLRNALSGAPAAQPFVVRQ